ncbi:hypothetical protein [uncultured Thiodictyon sp.]|uniref:WD40 repeat domain-containing protein n=1 Tax=uncultured Thiodictyon sp. TaxID=1846217 RepID=UPI0025D4846B|nr:hypothetical protein [uncultured Thiodictyon sp.]
MLAALDDFGIRIWCGNTGRELAFLPDSPDSPRWVVRIAFAPDSPRLASVSHDGTIRLWDCSAGPVC